MSKRLAVKRLVAVEVAPETSNQHEFNAGSLRRELGFPEGKTSGDFNLLFCVADGVAPEYDEGRYTLYDARENHPTRSEYRLYYSTPRFSELALEGDLLVLFRDDSSDELDGIVVRRGTDAERRVQAALRLQDSDSLHSFFFVTPESASIHEVRMVAEALVPPGIDDALGAVINKHPVFIKAVEDLLLPPTLVMATSGREIASEVWGPSSDPDLFIQLSLEAETALFFAIEREVGSRSLHEILASSGIDMDEVLGWALKLQQSRKSRRGQSLQHHFAALLTRESIPFSSQARTEGKQTPDFLVPGVKLYHDSSYPASRLRMVACKSTIRERWGQILKEAARIPEKYLLTVDDGLTEDVVRAMRDAQLRIFMPAKVLSGYSGRANRADLGTVGLLIGELKGIL
jgi:hypothetical protein